MIQFADIGCEAQNIRYILCRAVDEGYDEHTAVALKRGSQQACKHAVSIGYMRTIAPSRDHSILQLLLRLPRTNCVNVPADTCSPTIRSKWADSASSINCCRHRATWRDPKGTCTNRDSSSLFGDDWGGIICIRSRRVISQRFHYSCKRGERREAVL
jgi:hypothetical protein